ncbi:MAG TPA: tetratricopeptide repeat protein [Candidatus Polarisedimenticolia bacterium]
MPSVSSWLTGIILLPAALAAADPAAAPAPAGVPDVLPGLEALRAGRFEEARGRFERITASNAAAPEGPFFEAFQLWWRLLELSADDQSKELRLKMEERLKEAALRARALAVRDEGGAKERGLVFTGIAMFLEAESKVARGAPFAAASSVRQGHRALSQALELNPASADALFALGTYNYYADHVSLLVKGLRFVLFIPGGDERKGIEQLESAAARSRLFGTESLLLLAHIFSGSYAQDYRRALGYLETASARHPSSPLLALIQADLEFRVGRLNASTSRAESALEMVRAGPGYMEELEWLAAYRVASCAYARHDPLGALERIETSLERIPPRSPLARKRWIYLLGSVAREAGATGVAERWIPRLELTPEEAESLRRRMRDEGPAEIAPARAAALRALASGLRDEARRRLEEMLSRHPLDARLHYDLGRLLQTQGRLEEARPHLRAALAGASGPQEVDIEGRAMLRLGWDLERGGHRSEAIDLYRRAADLKSFVFRDAARDLIEHPAVDQPEG